MTQGDLVALATAVVASVFALAFVFGAITQRTNFCTMGSVADVVTFGDWTRMRQWLLAIAVAILGTNLLAATGVIDTADSFYTSPRFTPLAYVIGGLLFGFGMVLTGGCGSKSLVRAGAGSLKSLVVLVVLGIVAYISLRGLLAVFRVGVIEPVSARLATPQDLPSLLAGFGLSKSGCNLASRYDLGGIVLRCLSGAQLSHVRQSPCGLGIGAIIVAAWAVSGPSVMLRASEHVAVGFLANQLGPHGVAIVRCAGGLYDRLFDVLQRHQQGSDDRHRRGAGHDHRLCRVRTRCRAVSLGRVP